MKPIKILHSSDFHYSREDKEKALLSLRIFYEKGKEEKIDLFVLAGDLFDRALNNTESSGFPDLIHIIQQMMNVAPVVTVYGTKTHDIPGCYEPFKEIEAERNFTILQPGEAYFFDEFNGVVHQDFIDDQCKLLILGIPEPSKEWFTANKPGLGKDESDQLINDEMRKLLLGFGAIRKQYSVIPCLLVSHIEIANVPTCSGHIIQKGIKIGKDDLALVGADYYALGHIHLAQQIGDLPAYYAGSAFPVDWAEIDKKGFNLVEFDGIERNAKPLITPAILHPAYVDRIPYPHAPRLKIITDLTGLDRLDGTNVKGFDVWLQIKVDKEKRGSVDIVKIDDKLKERGALMGTRVEIVVKPIETIRSAEMQEATSLKEKVNIYTNLSGEKLEAGVLEKSDLLEATAKEEGLTAEGLHIRIKKLSLRGAIGIRKGLGMHYNKFQQDQVEVDFDQYDPGIIALIGVNGSGKTTLIENMHPYPQMLTRQGKLQDHFCLRDSFRDLYFIDERTGIEYRAFIQIDGVNKSGGAEYFLYQLLHPDNDWIPLTNGRKESYETEINKLFGSLKLFLRSAFVSQKQPKNLPDLSDATKGEKKALFRELGGLDYLQVYADSAKEKWQVLDRELIGDRTTIEGLEEQVKALPDKKGELLLLESSKEVTEKKLKELREKGFSLKDQEKELLKSVEKNKELRITIDNASKELESYEEELETLNLKIDAYRSSLEGKADFEVQLTKFEDLKKQEAKFNEEKTKVLEEREKLSFEYNNKREVVANAERSLLDQKAEIEKESSEAHRERDVLEVEVKGLEEELSQPYEDCPTCGQKWPPDKLSEFKQKRAEKGQKKAEKEQKINVFDENIKTLQKELTNLDTNIAELQWPLVPKLPEFDNDVQLSGILREINLFPAEKVTQNLETAKEAEVRIEEGTNRVELIFRQIDEITVRKAELMNFIDKEAEVAYEAITAELEDTRARYSETDKELVKIATEITNIEDQIKSIQNQLEVLQKIIQGKEEKEKDLQEWQYLQRACGPDGIQALELDAMGPGIADVANSILESAYGSRFQIEFRTTRIGGSGSKTKQIEDFLIVIHDSQDGSEQLLETLSGGESVWIKRSIYDAFGIIRARKTGTKFLTCIMDEADGALDPESRMHYFRMLQKAHEESGRHHTIIISHSQECQEMIDQKIEMSELGEVVREEVAV